MGIVSREDWSLHRKGQQAQARHQAKVKEAIRDNLRNVIANDGLILSDGKQVIRIPVHSLDEPHFHFNRGKQKHVGQGKAKTGQVIGRSGDGNSAEGPGDAPGEHVVESEITIDEIEEILFASLELPNLRPKPKTAMQVEGEDWTDVRRRGIQSNLDRKRTFMEAMKRSQRQGALLRITEDDLRFRTYEEVVRPQTGAVIFAMMDVSASMGEFEKYVARTFFFWMERFLSKHYPHVEIRYLVHHTEAAEVTKSDFYRLRESGGTKCSSVYELALQLMEREYPTDAWNVYPMHVSDGDNNGSDNEEVVRIVEKLCESVSLLGYLEVQPNRRASTLSKQLEEVDSPYFRSYRVASRAGILEALLHFFKQGTEGKEAGGR